VVKINDTKIAPLTSARFLAALYVVVFHTAYNSGFWLPHWLTAILRMGSYSVSFFFVLSGYILATVYLGGKRQFALKRFWQARFARVYPLFFLLLVLDTPYILLGRAARYGWHSALWKTAVNFGLDLAMMQGWSPAFNAINFPSWSLSDEAFFYALFPFVGAFVWRMRPRTASAFGVVLYLLTIAAGILLHRMGFPDEYAYNLPLLKASEFVLGILAAKLHMHLLVKDRNQVLLHRASLPLLITCAAVFCLAAYVKMPAPQAMVTGIFQVPVSIGFILALSSGPVGVSRALSARLPVVLGEASFALYLLHIPLWHLYQGFHLGGIRSHYIGFLLVAIGLSACSFYWFETPARRMILSYGEAKDLEGSLRSSIAQ
jgi:peptidoglycan/LPS O-acetylase OafA/YrhL